MPQLILMHQILIHQTCPIPGSLGVFFFFFFGRQKQAMLRPSSGLLIKNFKLNCLEKGCVVNMMCDIVKMDQIALYAGETYTNK